MTKREFAKRGKAHIRYRTADGKHVPGVTTILGVLAKPALITWANQMGLEGIDTTKYVDAAARVGTLAHYLVECHLKGEGPSLDDYAPNEVQKAEWSFKKFEAYAREHDLEPILLETPLVSEEYRYGGTVDYYGLRDGIRVVIDFKTGSALYPDNLTQAVAYRQLVFEHTGEMPEAVYILRIGREESEGFEERKIGNIEAHWKLFQLCRQVYDVRKEAK